jgi:DNA-binding transcriptional LysR family regulator
VDLIRGEYDFSLRVGRASELSWVERHVGHSEQWLVGTGRLLLASGLPSKIGDLEGYPAIVTGSRQRFDEIGFDVRLVTDDLEGGLHAALAGAGIAALPRWLVRPYVESGRLVRVLPEEVIMKAPVVLLHPRRLRRVARDVMDHLARHLSKALLE